LSRGENTAVGGRRRAGGNNDRGHREQKRGDTIRDRACSKRGMHRVFLSSGIHGPKLTPASSSILPANGVQNVVRSPRASAIDGQQWMCFDQGVHWVANRVVAAFALTAVLACLALGVCWRLFARDKHGCCARTSAMGAPEYPCPSAATQVSAVKVAPSPSVTLPVPADPLPFASRLQADSAFAPSFPVKSPPLVLRI
jgi:hypothetical protein